MENSTEVTQLSRYSLTEFERLISSESSALVVIVGAEWSGSFYMTVRQMVNLREEFQNKFEVRCIDFDTSHELMSDYGISEPPAILFFSKGVLRDKLLGTTPKDIIYQKITELL
jgi:thioredoxin 1